MFIWCILIVFLVYLDQLTKWLAIILLQGNDSFPIIQDVLHLTYVENTGAAFGMLKDSRWVFMIASSIAVIGLMIFMFKYRPKSKWVRIGVALIISGGIGNMIDRILLGYVVDFIDVTLINFAVFNGADSFVCVGAAVIVLFIIVSSIKEYKSAKAAESLVSDTQTENEQGSVTTAENNAENNEPSGDADNGLNTGNKSDTDKTKADDDDKTDG